MAGLLPRQSANCAAWSPRSKQRVRRSSIPASRSNPAPGWCANGPGRPTPSSCSRMDSIMTGSAVPRSRRSRPRSPARTGPALAFSASRRRGPGALLQRNPSMTDAGTIRRGRALRCAIYTRKSSEEGLEQQFNSLHAQREACEAYIKSQRHEGWVCLAQHYDDGGLSGATMDRPALRQLLADIQAGKIDAVVTYKVDRLTRSLADFAKIVEIFDAKGVSFVSVTQQFNTTTSMGRLTLNVLLSFAQFEREVAGERIRDKFAASRRKAMWMGGTIPLGYDVKDRKLTVNEAEAETVRLIFARYLALGCVSKLRDELDRQGVRSKQRILPSGRVLGGCSFGRGALYHLLRNRIYLGEVVHKGVVYPGEHEAIVDRELWMAVQAKLNGNVVRQRQSRVESGALLSGLIFDDRGNRMSPTHTMRRGNRYRYYVSQALLRGRREDAGSLPRVGADDVEQLVVDALGSASSRETAPVIWTAEPRTLVRDSVERVVVHCNEVDIILKAKAEGPAMESVDGDADDAAQSVLKIRLPDARPRAR